MAKTLRLKLEMALYVEVEELSPELLKVLTSKEWTKQEQVMAQLKAAAVAAVKELAAETMPEVPVGKVTATATTNPSDVASWSTPETSYVAQVSAQTGTCWVKMTAPQPLHAEMKLEKLEAELKARGVDAVTSCLKKGEMAEAKSLAEVLEQLTG